MGPVHVKGFKSHFWLLPSSFTHTGHVETDTQNNIMWQRIWWWWCGCCMYVDRKRAAPAVSWSGGWTKSEGKYNNNGNCMVRRIAFPRSWPTHRLGLLLGFMCVYGGCLSGIRLGSIKYNSINPRALLYFALLSFPFLAFLPLYYEGTGAAVASAVRLKRCR